MFCSLRLETSGFSLCKRRSSTSFILSHRFVNVTVSTPRSLALPRNCLFVSFLDLPTTTLSFQEKSRTPVPPSGPRVTDPKSSSPTGDLLRRVGWGFQKLPKNEAGGGPFFGWLSYVWIRKTCGAFRSVWVKIL